MTKPVLIQTGKLMQMIVDQLVPVFEITRLDEVRDREAVLKEIGPSVVAIASGGHVPVDRALMARLPELRIVSHFGVGYDTVDAVAAGERGIVVTNTPDVLSDEVADTTIGLLLMTVRELGRAERWVRDGSWVARGPYPLTPASLRDRSFGIVGLGRIGQAIARRLEGFGRPIAYHTRRPVAGVAYRHYPSLIELARETDTLIIITPGGAATKNLVDADVLRAMGPRGILINVARGSVVDEPALIEALRSRTIMAAGLDVFAAEPKVPAELLALDNVAVLPHVASASVHTRNLMGQLVVDNLVAYATRKAPLTPVAETPFRSW